MAFCNYCKVGSTEQLKKCACRKVFYCNEKCQANDWKNHKPSCPPYRVGLVPGMRRGLFATRKIKAGGIILQEMPLLTAEGLEFEEFSNNFLTNLYPTIDEDTKSKILKLHNPALDFGALDTMMVMQLFIKNPHMRSWTSNPDDSFKIMNIFGGNCVKVCEDSTLYQNVEEVALYNNISLINHSCIPNSIMSWVKGDFKRKEVRALRTIEKGEEILVNYSDKGPDTNYGSKTREMRRQELLDQRGFLCQCSECSLEGKALEDNERLREKIGKMRASIALLIGVADFDGAMKASHEMIDLVKKLDIRLQFLKEYLGACMVANVMKKLAMSGPDPDIYKEAALGYAIGDANMHHYNETLQGFDMLLYN